MMLAMWLVGVHWEAITLLKESALIQVQTLKKYFPVSRSVWQKPTHFIHAVDDISFNIASGECLALVGESGCGKSTTGRLLVKAEEPSAGSITLAGTNVAKLAGTRLRQFFRRQVQMIFQDPYESLNPRLTIYDTIAEPLHIYKEGTISQRQERVEYVLNKVGLTPTHSFLFRYPHELSGGQRQRVAIARALVMNPLFIVADEPTSMLDVSIRIQVMRLLADLQSELGVSYLYITHDLAVARYMCQRIAVMYLGKIVEMGATADIIHHPQHPYTQALISAVPSPNPQAKLERVNIKGDVCQAIDPPPYCRFFNRCPRANAHCANQEHPQLMEKAPGHLVACYQV